MYFLLSKSPIELFLISAIIFQFLRSGFCFLNVPLQWNSLPFLLHMCTLPSYLSEDIDNFVFSFSLRDAAVSRWSLGHFSPTSGSQITLSCLLTVHRHCTTYVREEGKGSLGNYFFQYIVLSHICVWSSLRLALPWEAGDKCPHL